MRALVVAQNFWSVMGTPPTRYLLPWPCTTVGSDFIMGKKIKEISSKMISGCEHLKKAISKIAITRKENKLALQGPLHSENQSFGK